MYCKSENEYTSVLSLFMYIHVREVTFEQKNKIIVLVLKTFVLH